MHYGTATIGKRNLFVELDALTSAQVAASHYGFYDVDLVDNDKNMVTIVATGHKRATVTVSGKSITDAVDRLLERFGE